MTNPDSILKSRDITLPTKACTIKADFSSSHVQIWELGHKESWALNNWCFELWGWRRLLRVPWKTRRSNQSILKEISHGRSLERLMLKLKLQYFGHLMWKADSLEKTLMLRKIEGRRRRGWQRMRWLDGISYSMDMGLGGLRELVSTGFPYKVIFLISTPHPLDLLASCAASTVSLNWVTQWDLWFFSCY